MSAKRWGYAAIAFGALAVLVAVLADPLGIGGGEGFGWKQGFLLSMGVFGRPRWRRRHARLVPPASDWERGWGSRIHRLRTPSATASVTTESQSGQR